MLIACAVRHMFVKCLKPQPWPSPANVPLAPSVLLLSQTCTEDRHGEWKGSVQTGGVYVQLLEQSMWDPSEAVHVEVLTCDRGYQVDGKSQACLLSSVLFA